jgi:hypothetical protein
MYVYNISLNSKGYKGMSRDSKLSNGGAFTWMYPWVLFFHAFFSTPFVDLLWATIKRDKLNQKHSPYIIINHETTIMISLDSPHLLEHAYPHTWLQHPKQQVSQSLHNPMHTHTHTSKPLLMSYFGTILTRAMVCNLNCFNF